MDSQSVMTLEESAHIRGYDAHKCVKGHKRHLLVDTLGLPIATNVTSADVHDTVGARKLLSGLAFFVPCLKKIWADAAYRGKELAGGAASSRAMAGIWRSWSVSQARAASAFNLEGG
jgi:putative transposase